MSDIREKLKPCPYCGSEALNVGFASCSEEGCIQYGIAVLPSEWNQRAYESEITALQEENERLRKVIFKARDQIFNSPIDCLGSDCTTDGQAYPIRDEMVYRFTQALQEQDK